MASVDVGLQTLAAVATATVALLVAANTAAGRSRTSLVAFLVLLATNHAAEALRGAGLGDAEAVFRVASIAAALDPLALVIFVGAAAPSRHHWGLSLIALAGCGALALWAGWGPLSPSAPPGAFPVALAVFTSLVYVALAVLLLVAPERNALPGWLLLRSSSRPCRRSRARWTRYSRRSTSRGWKRRPSTPGSCSCA